MSTKHIPISSIVGMNANAMSAGGDSVGGSTDGGGGNSADAAAARRSAAAAAKSAEQSSSDASRASNAAFQAAEAANNAQSAERSVVEIADQLVGVPAEIEALKAGQSTSAIYADTLADLQAVSGTYDGQGAFVVNGVGAGQYRWNGSAWEFLREDSLAAIFKKSEDIPGASLISESGNLDYMLIWHERDGTPRFGVPIPREEMAGVAVTSIYGVASVDADETGSSVLRAITTDGRVHEYSNAPRFADISAVCDTPDGYTTVPAQGMLIKDCIYSWWCTGFWQFGKHIYIGGLGHHQYGDYGQLKLSAALYGSEAFETTIIGDDGWMARSSMQIDDHDRPALCLDPRPEARHPIVVAQSAHASFNSNVKGWRSKTIIAAHLSRQYIIPTGNNRSYNNLFRRADRPDEIWNIGRTGSVTGQWLLLRSLDDGATWNVNDARLIANAPYGIYPMIRPCEDGSGLMMTWHLNPGSAGPRGIVATKLSWDGAITDLAGDVIVEDIFAVGATAPNPYDLGTNIHTPITQFLRMVDLREVEPDLWQIAYLQGDTGVMENGLVYLKTIDIRGPDVVLGPPLPVAPAGRSLPDPKHASYLGGAAVIAKDTILCCRILPSDSPSESVVDIYSVAGGSSQFVAEVERSSEWMPARPEVCLSVAPGANGTIIYASLGEYVSYNKFYEYPDLENWRGDTQILNISSYQGDAE